MSSDYAPEAALPAEGVLGENLLVEPAREEEIIAPPPDVTAARALRFFALVAMGTVIVDQLSKAWIRDWLPLHSGYEIVPGVLTFFHILNEGAAWSMLAGQRFFLIGVTLVVMVVVLQMAREFAPHSLIARLGLGLIFGGAVGNLIDRVWLGAVTDFIDLDTSIRWIREFPVFNIADSALTVGVGLLLFEMLWHRRSHLMR